MVAPVPPYEIATATPFQVADVMFPVITAFPATLNAPVLVKVPVIVAPVLVALTTPTPPTARPIVEAE